MSWRIFATEFESVNYYSKHYLFDAQIYSVNTFVSENSLTYEIGNFTPHLDYGQYRDWETDRKSTRLNPVT